MLLLVRLLLRVRANVSVRARLLRAGGGDHEARVGADAQVERAPLRALIDARKPEAGVAVGGEREAVWWKGGWARCRQRKRNNGERVSQHTRRNEKEMLRRNG